MTQIVNAAPMTIMYGTQDKSIRALVPEAEVLPTHLPKIYIYAKKGSVLPRLAVGGTRTMLYGEDSFDLRKKWATHATALANTINAQGNTAMYQRVKPADAGPPASIRLSMDVLVASRVDPQRNVDGSIKTDPGTGLPVPGATVAVAHKVKWVVEQVSVVAGDSTFGVATQGPGDQTDAATSTQSVRYPIMDIAVPDFGSYGNDLGVRLWAPTQVGTNPLDARVLTNEKVYPFRMACVARATELTTPRVVETASAEQFVNVCLKPDTINRVTDTELYVNNVFLQAYATKDNPTLPELEGPFGRLHVYDANVKTLLEQFTAAEAPYLDGFSDQVNGTADEAYLFNPVSGVSSLNVPYHSFELVSGTANAQRLSESSTIFARGGTDGTMDETRFAALVAQEVAEYANPNSILQDTARYPESIIYDSGFPLATKYALCSALAVRKDIGVVLVTHDVLGPALTASEESALAVALRTRLQMYPESEYFGTPAMRGVVIGRSGEMLGTQYRKNLPLGLEIANNAAGYMGAGNGKWRPGLSFDMAPASEVKLFRNVNVTFTPATVRNKDWANGLNWVESYGHRSLYFPAIKTVYNNDTSILTSFFTMMAIIELQKVGDRARRKFSGVSSLSNAQLVERVNQFVTDNTIGRFDNRFVIVPETYFTEADLASGYRWSLRIKIYGPNMKTVMSLSVESYRIEDLAG